MYICMYYVSKYTKYLYTVYVCTYIPIVYPPACPCAYGCDGDFQPLFDVV